MFKLLGKIPKKVTVAFSGGVDSAAVVDFLSRNHDVDCAFFHHGTDNSDRASTFVTEFCYARNLHLRIDYIRKPRISGISLEEHWRNERYTYLEKIKGAVITAHNLDDCVETYVWSALHGQPKVIPYQRNNIIRPFLLTPKSEFIDWCQRKQVPWCEDLSNQDTKYMRNYVRRELMPHAVHVNPGLATVVKKIVEQKFVIDCLSTPL
jgi:tRNA(Ile)-lysidine synthase